MNNMQPKQIDEAALKFEREIAKNENATINLFSIKTSSERVVIKRGQGNDKNTVAHEAKIMAGLSHPHIVQFYKYTVTTGCIHRIFMEYIEHSLDYWLAQDPNLNDKNADNTILNKNHLNIAKGLAAALTYLHQHNIVHCDIKLANILASNDYKQIKICDFGLSSDLSITDKTAISWSKGTPVWLAPEIASYTMSQLKTPPTDPYKMDIWAMGQVLLQLYINTNGKPYNNVASGPSYLNLYLIISQGQHDKIPKKKPLTPIIQVCLDKNPEARPNAEAILVLLNEGLDKTPSKPSIKRL